MQMQTDELVGFTLIALATVGAYVLGRNLTRVVKNIARKA